MHHPLGSYRGGVEDVDGKNRIAAVRERGDPPPRKLVVARTSDELLRGVWVREDRLRVDVARAGVEVTLVETLVIAPRQDFGLKRRDRSSEGLDVSHDA
jgi:hypothetical protein